MNEITNIITIEKNIPLPLDRHYRRDKYCFMNKMEVGDSFVVNGNTPEISAKAMRSHCYGMNGDHIKKGNCHKYAIRTLEGHSKLPTAIRVWRVK